MASHAGVEEEGEEDRFFQVHCILSASLKSIGTGLEGEELTSWYYKIRWFGYTDEDDTSEPEAHLECPELLADFWKYVSGRKLKSGKYSTEYTASPAWIRKQLEHLTEAGKQKDEKLEIKPKSQKPEKHKKSNEPPRKKTSSDTKGKSVDKSSPDFTTIDSDSSKSPTDLFGVELSSSDSPSPPLPKSVRRKRGRVIVDESSDDGDDDVPLATLAARSQKPCKASSSASGSAGSHAHTSQTSVRASASVHPATGSHTSPVPAMTQSPGKAHNPEPTAMPSDKMKVIPSKSNRKASDDARKGALGSAARAGPAKAIAGNPSASRRKIASSSTLTTATESRDAGRRPPALSSSSAGPSKSSVSTSPQKSSTRKLSFTKNSKLNPSALLQTSPAIITDKHRGARIMMVDGLPALPPERPRANKPSYSKLVKKLPKANTATAGNFMLSLPPKWPRRFSRLTAEKPPADATPNNTQAPSQSDAADNALSGCDDASPKMTCGSTGVQREAPEHCPGLLTEEPPSMFNIELVNGSSAETIPVNCGGAVNTDGDYASVLNTSRGASTDVICHAPWIGDIELKLAGGGGATLRASLTSASSTGTVNPLVPVDIFRSLSGITFERTYSIEDYVNLIKPAHGPVREFAMVEDSDSDDKNRKWIKNLAAYLEDTNQIAMGFIEMSDAVFHRCIVIIVSLNSDRLDSVFNAPVLTGLMSSSLLLALIPQVHDQQLRIDLHSSSSKIHVITTDSSHGALPADRPEGQVQGSTSPSFSMGLRLKLWPALDKEQYYLPYRHTIAHLQLTDGDMEFLYKKEFAMFPDEDARMDVETRAVFNLMTRLLKAKNVHLVDMNAKAVLIHRKSILDLANLPKLHERKRDFPDFVFYTYGWGPYRQDARGSKLQIAFQMGVIITLTARVIVNRPIAVERLAKYVEEHPVWELYISPATLALAYVLATSESFNPNGPKSTLCASVVLHLARHLMNPVSELGHIHALGTKLRFGADTDAAEGAHIAPEAWGLEQELILKADPFDLVDQSMLSLTAKVAQLLEAAAPATAAITPTVLASPTAQQSAPTGNTSTGKGSTQAHRLGVSAAQSEECESAPYKGKGKANSQDRGKAQNLRGSGDRNTSILFLKDETPESLLKRLSQQMRPELERDVEDETVANLKALQLQPTLQEEYRRFVLVSDTGTGVGSVTGPQAVSVV